MLVLVIAIISYAFYLALTAGSGNIILWSMPELVVGLIVSIITGIVSKNVLGKEYEINVLNPNKWLKFLAYVGYWFIKLVQANMDVALRVLTGRINPGIIKIDSQQTTNIGIFMLANSITLTPGTLTVDATKDHSLYVHCISVNGKNQNTETLCKMAEKIKEIVK